LGEWRKKKTARGGKRKELRNNEGTEGRSTKKGRKEGNGKGRG